MSEASNTPSVRHEPPEPIRAWVYGWEYRRKGRFGPFAWYGSVGGWQPGFFAWTEKGMRNKLARFIRRQRANDLRRRTTTRRSSL